MDLMRSLSYSTMALIRMTTVSSSTHGLTVTEACSSSSEVTMSFKSFSKDIDNHHIGRITMDQRVHQLEEDIKEAMGDSFKPQGEHTLGDILDRATASLKKDKKEPTPWTTTENLNRTMDE